MKDKTLYSLMILCALVMIGLSLAWPQGLGSRSPKPFGHDIIMPDVVRMEREKAQRAEKKKADEAARAEAKRQNQAYPPLR